MSLTTELRSRCPARVKNKTPLSQLQHYVLVRLTSTTPQLRRDLLTSNGPRVFKGGTSAQSLMARIIQRPRIFSQKRGGKSLASSAQRSFSQFSPTKICPESVKRSRRSLIRFFSQKFAASEQPTRRRWRGYFPPSLHHSPTPSPGRLVMRLSWRAQSQIQFY